MNDRLSGADMSSSSLTRFKKYKSCGVLSLPSTSIAPNEYDLDFTFPPGAGVADAAGAASPPLSPLSDASDDDAAGAGAAAAERSFGAPWFGDGVLRAAAAGLGAPAFFAASFGAGLPARAGVVASANASPKATARITSAP